MRFAFADTHAYPGCRVVLDEPAVMEEILAEFSDGSVVPALRQETRDGLHLTVGAYTTRGGTRIPGKSWLLRPGAPEGTWRVVRRIPDQAGLGPAGPADG